jgi:hypothetical protein
MITEDEWEPTRAAAYRLLVRLHRAFRLGSTLRLAEMGVRRGGGGWLHGGAASATSGSSGGSHGGSGGGDAGLIALPTNTGPFVVGVSAAIAAAGILSPNTKPFNAVFCR